MEADSWHHRDRGEREREMEREEKGEIHSCSLFFPSPVSSCEVVMLAASALEEGKETEM